MPSSARKQQNGRDLIAKPESREYAGLRFCVVPGGPAQDTEAFLNIRKNVIARKSGELVPYPVAPSEFDCHGAGQNRSNDLILVSRFPLQRLVTKLGEKERHYICVPIP